MENSLDKQLSLYHTEVDYTETKMPMLNKETFLKYNNYCIKVCIRASNNYCIKHNC